MIETRYQLLDYIIIGASSEDPRHRITQISSSTPDDGWQSVRFCSYPQEILIKFNYPVHLRQVNLLFHETNIPSKVDIYHFFPKNYKDFLTDYNSLVFDKIGYIEPDSNSHTNYQCREYKRVSLAENCTYLKLVFHKCIYNIYNPFNQVALINLQCLGFIFSENNLQEIFPDNFNSINQNIYNNPLEIPNLLKTENFDKYIPTAEIKDNNFHPKCASKLEDLNNHLERAKFYDDDEKGKLITDFIEQVRLIGYKVEHLNKLKKIAIDKEDYGKAKEIKIEIDKILGFIDDIDPNYYRLPTPPQEEHQPPSEQLSMVFISREPSLNEDIKNYRIIDDVPRKKILYDVQEGAKINGEEEKKENKDGEENKEDLEKRGFHDVINDKKEDEESVVSRRTFSLEDSVREELKFKIEK